MSDNAEWNITYSVGRKSLAPRTLRPTVKAMSQPGAPRNARMQQALLLLRIKSIVAISVMLMLGAGGCGFELPAKRPPAQKLIPPAVFGPCMTGPASQASETCRICDYDWDGDVDLADWWLGIIE